MTDEEKGKLQVILAEYARRIDSLDPSLPQEWLSNMYDKITALF